MLSRRVVRSSLVGPCTFARAFSRTSVRLNDDVLKRYKDKLHQRVKAEGLESIHELKNKYQDEIKNVREKFDKIDPLKHLDPEAAAKTELSKDRGRRPNIPDEEKVKDLSSFVDVARLSMHPSKEIEMIWKARFASQENSICGALDGVTFSRIYRNTRRFPRFVLPLPHEGQGAELHFVQWAFPGPYTMHCMFTSLAEFKLHQEYARPHTTMAIHSELLADKEMALMNGSVEKDSSLNQAHGAFLAANIQRFYGADESTESGLRKVALLEAFNSGSSEFSPERLIAEVETLD
ncbi:protein Atp11p, mitochondrial [Trichomonascus vanleenenianus]|uniref:Atp11p n=1 Tax=Trichomonascus vanleenenianus TaxID=2268995 RepID=UPI003EC9A060